MEHNTKGSYSSNHFRLRSCWLGFALICWLTPVLAKPQSQEVEATPATASIVAIISHSSNSDVTLSDVKRLYSLRKRLMDNGESALLTMLPLNTKESVEVFRFLVGMYPYQLQRTWDRAIFSGKGTAPTQLPDSSKVLEYVSTNTSAIGYISIANIQELEALKESVNVIATIP